ncbi:MAG: orotate phosphoribosyltransferase [Aquificaceae bacterium]|nr:orotate phosphoribosyltransferase [Aquificaceae bacterium]MDW8237301.1 orotate phosphoribosyltransferase [Aquificaceae bacterium]
MQESDYQKLRELIKLECLRVESEPIFTLSSGKKSNIYINLKKVTMTPSGLMLVSKLMFDLIKPFNLDAVGGLTMGADPIAYGVCMYAYNQGIEINPVVVRKERKSHGTGKQVEGVLPKKARVGVLEDVITTGSSVKLAINAIREEGYDVVGVFSIVDRLEGAKESLEGDIGVYKSLYTIKELL